MVKAVEAEVVEAKAVEAEAMKAEAEALRVEAEVEAIQKLLLPHSCF